MTDLNEFEQKLKQLVESRDNFMPVYNQTENEKMYSKWNKPSLLSQTTNECKDISSKNKSSSGQLYTGLVTRMAMREHVDLINQ
jgi:hypothetical protein